MNGKKKNSVLIFTPGGVGGAERMSMSIASYLSNASYRVRVYSISSSDDLIRDFLPDGIEFEHMPARNQWDFVCTRIFIAIRRYRPDIVFTSHFYLAPKLILAARIAGSCKVILRIPNYLASCDSLTRFLCSRTLRYADCVIAQQEEMRDEVISSFNLDPDKVIVLHNPVNTSQIDRKVSDAESPFVEKGTVNYLLVARMNPMKGHDRLLRAFKLLHSKNPESRLFLVGNPVEGSPFNAFVKKYILDNRLSDCVKIIGYDLNPYRWMKYCDCFVLTSRIEGLPNALIEAQYLGTPCVAVNCVPIIDRIISDGLNGYVVPADDDAALADAMAKAARMGRIRMTYKSASPSDFVDVFDKCL